uniref:Uncharacterized protein n=1 Tax=Geoglobus ahangari TaxID=113653 RepID=A0A7C3YFG2_9EURY
MLCPAENYKLLGKDFKEPGWVVGDADSSGFEIMFKEWKQILLTRASCSYQGVAVKTTSAGVGLTHKRPSTLERWTSPFLARERMNRLNFM